MVGAQLRLAVCAWLCVRAGAGAEAVRRALAAGGTFAVESATLINSAERKDRDLGYRIVAELEVAPVGPAPGPGPGPGEDADADADVLLRFQLRSARLTVRGAHRSAEWEPRGSVWDAGAGAAWYARLRRGAVAGLLLDPAEPADVRDYKRALASLFQFQAAPAGEERNETDASGACAVAYEALAGGEFRRVKLRCAADGAAGAGAAGAARRAARYSLAGGALRAVRAHEALTLHAALKARSWLALERRAPPPAPAPAPPPGLRAEPLAPAPAPAEPDDEDASLEAGAAIRRYRAALEGEAAGAGGGAQAARALLRLLPALRAAPHDALRAALRDDHNRDVLPGLCRALGLAGSAAAVRAARDFLQPAAADPLEPLALAFLGGFALAARADDEAVLDVLRLAAEARRGAVADAALLAAAAAAAAPAPRAAVRDALARGLARCRDAACRAVRLLALGNMRADEPELLVGHAERDEPRAAAAALAALAAAPALAPPHLARVARLAADAARPLEVRAAALEAVVARRAAAASPAPAPQLVELAGALHAERSRAAHELRRVLWQRLEALGEAAPVRALLPLLPPALRTWDARAHGGTSSVLRRDTGWGAGGWRAVLDSVQVAAGGLLRRGTVALLAVSPDGAAAPELEVSVWTRGLEALAGGAGADEEKEEEEEEGVAGGLAIAVGGARMPDVSLFDGQAELLGHIWAGTGGAATPALRALRALPEARGAVRLLCGGALRVRRRAAAALALDARAAASLWHRTARAALALRAALAADVSAALRTAWGSVRAARAAAAEPRLRIALDLDFYDGVALCVRASSPDHALEEELELESVLGARRLRVVHGATRRAAAPGRTLALGRANDAACRALRAADDDED